MQLLSAQEMVGSPAVTVQQLPDASVTQVMLGLPWHATVTVPTEAVGVKAKGAAMSTH